jgi:hypothetical protein
MNPFPHQKSLEAPLFKGFPYILTHLAGCLYHIILLPQASSPSHHIETARHQAQANRLPTWLVASEQEAQFFQIGFRLPVVVPVPQPRSIVFGKLISQEAIPEEREILIRYLTLSLHSHFLHGDGPALYVGDLTKGGRPVTDAEIEKLSGCQRNGIPKGLRQCAVCLGWYGICLDTTIPDLLVSVHCRCQNDNRCARCGQLLYRLKLNSNHFSESDGSIWHVPGFCARESCAGLDITHERSRIASSGKIQAPPRGSWSWRPKVT